jgi:transposase
MNEVISMSGQEIDRVGIIRRVMKREMRQKVAAERLNLSVRQVQRLVQRYAEDGPRGLISRKRGQPGNRVLPPELKREALNWIRERYSDFGPTLAAEKLYEVHDIRVGVETLRQWMIDAGLWIPARDRERSVHQPRRRRPCRGELIQIDGSPHDWFEGRGLSSDSLPRRQDRPSTSRVHFRNRALARSAEHQWLSFGRCTK